MKNTQKQIARGRWQQEIFDALVAGEVVPSPWANAPYFRNQARTSFENLFERMSNAGYLIIRTPGPRGGETLATYRVTKKI